MQRQMNYGNQTSGTPDVGPVSPAGGAKKDDKCKRLIYLRLFLFLPGLLDTISVIFSTKPGETQQL